MVHGQHMLPFQNTDVVSFNTAKLVPWPHCSNVEIQTVSLVQQLHFLSITTAANDHKMGIT